MQGTESMESYSPNLTKFWHPPRTCPLSNRVGGGGAAGGGISHSNPFDSNTLITDHNGTGLDVPPEMFDEYADSDEPVEGESEGGVDQQQRRRNKIIAGAARSKVSRSSESSLGLSSSNRLNFTACLYYAMILTNCAVVSVFSRL